MISRISHVAILVRDLDEALEHWRDLLGLRLLTTVEVPPEGARTACLVAPDDPGGFVVELVAPIDPGDRDNPLVRRLEQNGEGVHGLVMSVPDVTAAGRRLAGAGARTIGREPAHAGLDERLLLHPRSCTGVLVELVSDADRDSVLVPTSGDGQP